MRIRVLLISILANVLLVTLLVTAVRWGVSSRKDYKNILSVNQALHEDLKTLEGETSSRISQSKVLQLKLSELQKVVPELHAQIKALKVRPSRTESIAETGISSNIQIKTILRDSVVYDTVPVRHFSYADDYFRIDGYAMEDTQHLNITYRDTLVQAVYRGRRKRPWLWVFSPRQLEQKVSLKCPTSHINYSHFIEIQR